MAFDEAANLEAVVCEIRAALDRIGAPAEILVVDDGSRDATGVVADRLRDSIAGLRVIHHPANHGLGGVYRTGFAEAGGDLITFFPADGQFPASILDTFADRMANLDLVLGYVGRRDSVAGWALSACERAVYRLLLGPLPRFQGIFMVRREALARTELRSQGRGWAIVMELLVRASRAGWRVASVPTPIRPRLSGSSKVHNLPTIWANLRQVVALRRLI